MTEAIAFGRRGHERNVSAANPFAAGKTEVVSVTLSLDTNAYGASDLLADTQVVTDAFRDLNANGIVQTVTLIDKDDVGAALDLWFLSSNVTMGSENSAPSVSDTNAGDALMGRVSIATGDYYDLGGCKVAFLSGLAIPVKSANNTKDMYIAAVNGSGTPTYTASGLVARLGILQD